MGFHHFSLLTFGIRPHELPSFYDFAFGRRCGLCSRFDVIHCWNSRHREQIKDLRRGTLDKMVRLYRASCG